MIDVFYCKNVKIILNRLSNLQRFTGTKTTQKLLAG